MKTNTFRTLTGNEIELLKQQGNVAEDWTLVRVCDPFDATLLRNNTFMGHVNIGCMESGCIADGDLKLPEGIYNSMLSEATVGDHCALHHVRMLSGYTVGDRCLLFNIGEMTATTPRWLSDWTK